MLPRLSTTIIINDEEGTEAMTSWRTLKPIKRRNQSLLYAEDLGGKTSIDLEIWDVTGGQILTEDGREQTALVWFWSSERSEPRSKRLGLNATNGSQLQAIHGTDQIEQWIGWITLRVVVVEAIDRRSKQKVKVPALRISSVRPKKEPTFDYAARIAARTERTKRAGGKVEIEQIQVEEDEAEDEAESDAGSKDPSSPTDYYADEGSK